MRQATRRAGEWDSEAGAGIALVADVVGGLAPAARAELAGLAGVRLHRSATVTTDDTVRFDLAGDPRALLRLRTVQSVARIAWFDVPRPRALLGDQHRRRLMALIDWVRSLHPSDTFQTLALSAAGADSAVLTRLMTELAAATGLHRAEREGDLRLRLRRPADVAGWEVLLRLTPRPLATRAWRVCDWPGALNATVAAVMADLTRPRPADVVLNIGCGSGTLLIERLVAGPAQRALGCDPDPTALDCAQRNTASAGRAGAIEWQRWDARALPLPAASVDAILGDLPFGHLVGSHADNLTLYPALLAEAARVARSGARAILISHEARLMERLLAASAAWTVEQELRLALATLRPRVYVLVRRAG
ncbi:MAG: methyltransferase domain-containing protein [Chloroflexi bacterium]|nr:methyltransferase domain-containing protein [Chloroflexota bacterium]